MNFKQIKSKLILRLDPGEEIITALKDICTKQNISFATVVGIGATNKGTIGLFKVDSKKYITHEFSGDHEICNLTGTITRMNNEVLPHIHITLCDEQQKCFGGHLDAATVSATCEIILEICKQTITRKKDKTTGLNLLNLQ